jgi:bacillithiol system protein YtxJ
VPYFCQKQIMGLFGLFGREREKEETGVVVPWKALNRAEQLKTIEEASFLRPVAIFKHSTRCGISSMALRQFERNFDTDPQKIDLYYLDLLAYRSLSDEVAARFQVWHQSPQLIVLKNGVTVHHASHHNIQVQALENFLDQ